ncbi:MAG: cobyric acid synthase [Thermodesulfobacteriota bacterium]|nr:cobyric acid synthase [Thermodesulfobacteriota bacterium]
MVECRRSGPWKKCIAVFGTGSDVGKSIVAAAICRSLSDRGIRVAPFKAQNMSNNSGVTAEGMEMGRAQIVQAEAAGIAPHVDMNPVLLKPTGETGSQVVLNGRPYENSTGSTYHTKRAFYFNEACRAYDRLADNYDYIIMEGAGSCAEVNLMQSDIVNFPMAEYADADVILVADIHRGGVFGQIVGTLECLPPEYRNRIKGFVINRFRGDISLFSGGVQWIENKTGKPVFGVMPWYTGFRIDAEDSVEIEETLPAAGLDSARPAIAVIRLPHISNFTDFHGLTAIQGLQVIFIKQPCDLSVFRAVILPGTKNTRADLNWLRQVGLETAIQDYAGAGGVILGVCGGFQMLGKTIKDPMGIEDNKGCTSGLHLLDVETTILADKTTTRSSFTWNSIQGTGYEIHMGETKRGSGQPMCQISARNQIACCENDGAVSGNHKIFGTYIHAFFDNPDIVTAWLEMIGLNSLSRRNRKHLPDKNRDYDRLKNHFEKYVHLDFDEKYKNQTQKV